MRSQHANGVRMLQCAQALSSHPELLQRRKNVLLVEHSRIGERESARLAHEHRRTKRRFQRASHLSVSLSLTLIGVGIVCMNVPVLLRFLQGAGVWRDLIGVLCGSLGVMPWAWFALRNAQHLNAGHFPRESGPPCKASRPGSWQR